jgi:hypothetical protein
VSAGLFFTGAGEFTLVVCTTRVGPAFVSALVTVAVAGGGSATDGACCGSQSETAVPPSCAWTSDSPLR